MRTQTVGGLQRSICGLGQRLVGEIAVLLLGAALERHSGDLFAEVFEPPFDDFARDQICKRDFERVSYQQTDALR